MSSPPEPQLMLRRAAMDLLARREHTAQELRRKLRRRGAAEVPAEQLDELLDEVLQALAEEGLLSEQRFVESYLRQRAARGYGPLRLREELRQRGVAEGLARDALSVEAGWDWQARAAAAYRKRYGETPVRDARDAAARLRFMRYRGFSAEQLRPLLGDDW
jgi:regulatory protein